MNAPSDAPSTPTAPSPMPTVGDVLDLTHRICQLSRMYNEIIGNLKLKLDAELVNTWDERRARLRNLLLRDLNGKVTLKADLSRETIAYYHEIHALLHQ